MAKILVAYGTRHSQTQKIAEQICAIFVDLGHHADAVNVEKDRIFPDKYDAIVVGGPIHMGKYPRGLMRWVKNHVEVLTQRHTAFFSVCLGILQAEEDIKNEEKFFVERFFNKVNWYPQLWAVFAGAIRYSNYNWFKKIIMHRIARKAGALADPAFDCEYTDWSKVQSFAEKFLFELNSKLDFRNCCPVEVSARESSFR